jgi:hypothetical protein
MRDAYDKESLQSKGVKYILNCAKETKNYHLEANLFVYYNANLEDVEHQQIHLEPAIDFICKEQT